MQAPRRPLVALLLAILVCAGNDVTAQQALVRAASGNLGHAWTFTRSEICYALTANHVVRASSEADLVLAGSETKYVRGTVIARWPDIDVAMLRITADDVRSCGRPLILRQEIDEAMRSSATGELRQADSQGGVMVHSAELVQLENEVLGIRSKTAVALQPTFSGSVFYIGSVPVGILKDVTPKGVGLLTRMDGATQRALDHLSGAAAAAPSSAAIPECDASKSTASREDVAAAQNGGRVVAWRGMPSSFEAGAENLIANCRLWRVESAVFPISVTLQVGGGGPQRVRSVVLNASDVAPAERPTKYEVLVRSGMAGGWRPVASGQFWAQENSATHQLPDVLVFQVMVKLYGSQGGRDIALRRIHIMRSGVRP